MKKMRENGTDADSCESTTPNDQIGAKKSANKGIILGLCFLLAAAAALWFGWCSISILTAEPQSRAPMVSTEPSRLLHASDVAGRMPGQAGDAIRQSMMGTRVKWLLKLNSVKDIDGQYLAVWFQDGSKEGVETYVELSETQKDLLRLARTNDLFYVSGSIRGLGRVVELAEDYIEPYPINTNMP